MVAAMLIAVACGPGADSAASDKFGGRVYRRSPGTNGVLDAVTTLAGPASVSTLAGTPTTTTKLPYDAVLKPISCFFDHDSANRLSIDCFTLTLPMRRDQPSGAKIYLAIARIHSTSKTPLPDPVIYLDGGPGGSAIASVDRWTNPVSPLLENRDVILIDQRGTGYSLPRLNCDQVFLTSPKTEFEDLRPAATKCLADLQAQKIDVAGYNTTESAADIADVRLALKLSQVNLFGISYGTRLALWTVATHPEGIRSVVLDSTYPPVYAKTYEDIALNLNRAIEALFSDCDAQPACHGRYPDLRGALKGTISRLDASPLQILRYDPILKKRVKLPFTGGDFLLELFTALYITSVMPDIPQAISLGARGDIGSAVELFRGAGAASRLEEDDSHQKPRSARGRPSFTDGLNYSVECAESAPGVTQEMMDASGSDVPKEIRDPLALVRQRALEVCGVWGAPPKPLAEVQSTIPTLVLSGTYDPITPPDWGTHAASLLPNSRFVTVIGSGHAVYYAGDCPKQLVKQYLDDPNAPSPDCTGAPPEFSH